MMRKRWANRALTLGFAMGLAATLLAQPGSLSPSVARGLAGLIGPTGPAEPSGYVSGHRSQALPLGTRNTAWKTAGAADGSSAPSYSEDFTNSASRTGFAFDNTIWDTQNKYVRLARPDAASQAEPALASDSNGETVMAWTDWRNGHADIYAQRLDAAGNRQWPSDVKVNSDALNAEHSHPAIAIDAGNTAYIMWVDGRGVCCNAFVQKLSASGEKLWAGDVQVNRSAGQVAAMPGSLSVLTSGNLILAWADRRNGGRTSLYLQQLSPNGTGLLASDALFDPAGGAGGTQRSHSHPRLVGAGNSHAYLTWLSCSALASMPCDVMAEQMGADLSALWAAPVTVTSPAGKAIYTTTRALDAAADASGQLYVTWLDTRSGTPDVLLQRLSSAGARQWPADVRASANTSPGTGAPESPAIASGPDASVWVAWVDSRGSSAPRALMQRLDANGNRLWPADLPVSAVSAAGMTNAQHDLGLCATPTGEPVTVWREARIGAASDLFAQRMNLGLTRLWGSDVRLNDDGGTADQQPAFLTLDNAGNALVGWQDEHAPAGAFWQAVSPAGTRRWPMDIRLNTARGTRSAQDASGATLVVWAGQTTSAADSDIYAQKSDGSGNRLWRTPMRVNRLVSGSQHAPSVAANASGGFVVVWHDDAQSPARLLAQRLDADGHLSWATDVLVTDHVDGDQPSGLAVDAHGNTYVVWFAANNTTNTATIFAQRLDAHGAPAWAAPQRVNASDIPFMLQGPGADPYPPNPKAALDAAGALVVGWIDRRSGDADVYAQRLDASGMRTFAADVRVNSDVTSTPQTAVDVTTDMSGDIVFVWTEGHVFAQKLSSSGAKLWPGDVQVDDGQSRSASMPLVRLEESGLATVAWQDERRGNSDVYMQRLSAQGGHLWTGDLKLTDVEPFYLPQGSITSSSVVSVTAAVTRARLTANMQLLGGRVAFYLTNGSSGWLTVTPGLTTVFTATGHELRWKADLTTDPASAHTPVISGVQIDFSDSAPGDAYEPDDSCASASRLQVEGAAQTHTFHRSGDEDWARFDVVSGTTYFVETSAAGTGANPVLDLFVDCAQTPVQSNQNPFGGDARIVWRAPVSGPVWVRASNNPPTAFGPETSYQLGVRAASQLPIAIIVAGRRTLSDSLQANIDTSADQAYRTLLVTGTPKDRIRYLGPNGLRDVDGNGLNDDIAAPPTPANVRSAIQTWARQVGVTPGVPVYVYLAGHGANDAFIADGTLGGAGRISAADLDLWLSNLEAATGADKITVIIEAGLGGSFIDAGVDNPDTISKPNRVIIAATTNAGNAYPALLGAHFSDVFWTALAQNKDLLTAFNLAHDALHTIGLTQTPWLDDSGDGRADALDGALAFARGLGPAAPSHVPIIDFVGADEIVSGTASVRAKARDDVAVTGVWAEIYPPGFVEPAAPDGATPLLNIAHPSLTAVGNDLFTLKLQSLTQPGCYRVVVFARDADDNQATPQATRVCNPWRVHLPLVRR